MNLHLRYVQCVKTKTKLHNHLNRLFIKLQLTKNLKQLMNKLMITLKLEKVNICYVKVA